MNKEEALIRLGFAMKEIRKLHDEVNIISVQCNFYDDFGNIHLSDIGELPKFSDERPYGENTVQNYYCSNGYIVFCLSNKED